MAADQSFLADQMLIRLARWLRVVGQDVSNPPQHADDSDLIQIAKKDKRTLLTRDKALASRCKKAEVNCVLIESSSLESQLGQMKKLGISLEMKTQRCTLCNGKLEKTKNPERKKEFPHLEENAPLWECQSCGKVYWQGSHWNNIRKRLEKIDRNEIDL
ncbi:MAG: Mut7-C RNAse domain-containing protein [Methanotrichaceae archaeon]